MIGWKGGPFVELDGTNWSVGFAAGLLDIPEKDLRDLIRITGLQPVGVIRMSGYSRQGRQPRAYPAAKLIAISEAITALKDSL